MLVYILLIAISKGCIQFECIDLGANVCARKSLTTIMINTVNQCLSGTTCLTSDILSFDNSSDESLLCTPYTNDTAYNWNSFNYICGNRINKREFIGNRALITCTKDSDCRLEDGSYTACQCGTDGKNYCMPA